MSVKAPVIRPGTRFRGLKTTGWVLLLLPIAILAYEIARVTPCYLNYMRVVRSLRTVAAEYHAGDNPDMLPRLIAQRFAKEGVLYPQAQDIRISRDGAQWLMEASYDDQAPLIGNLAVLVSFEKTVRTPVGVTN